jgi:hypothetical protein
MIEQLWFVEEVAGKNVVIEWVSPESRLLLGERLRREIEKRVAGLGGLIKRSREFLAKMNISYGFVDIVIGVGEVRGREGSFHLVVPSMPCESAWIEFRNDSASMGGEPVQETLAEIVELDETGCGDQNHYYEEHTDDDG